MSLIADGISFVTGGRTLLAGVSLKVEPGQVHALLGPNGAGKTSLLRLLAGDRVPSSGTLELDGRSLRQWPAGLLARRRAVQGQEDNLRFPLTTDEVVALGRMPHAPEPEARETAVVKAALEFCGADALGRRAYLTLSGGERSRVRMARALAQVYQQLEAPDSRERCYLLLDEPVAHLDIAHQHFAMKMMRRFAQAGGGVLVILHDPNLALAYADAASLLKQGRLRATGPVNEVLTPPILEPVYGLSVQMLGTHDGNTLLAWQAPAGSAAPR